MIKLTYGDKHDFSDNAGAIKLSNEEVQKLIDEVLKDLNGQKDYGNSYSGTGDTMVFGFKYKDEIDIYVCKNYEEAEIFKENGEWTKVDWLYDYEKDEEIKELVDMLKNLPEDELISIIKKVLEYEGDSNDDGIDD